MDANPVKPSDADFELIDTTALMHVMHDSGSRLNIVILDACRNNPFGGRGLRDVGGGLAQMQAPKGTLISYATQPGNVAMDGLAGDNGPFAKALTEAMRTEGLDILQTFNRVGLTVAKATGDQQQPWLSSSPLEGAFFFNPGENDEMKRTRAELDQYKTQLAKAEADALAARAEAEVARKQVSTGETSSTSAPNSQPVDAPQPAAQHMAAIVPSKPPASTDDLTRRAYAAYDASHYDEALPLLRRLADQGDAGAEARIGQAYTYGRGVVLAYDQALQWFRKAADRGDGRGEAGLGLLYMRGWGVPQDYAQALLWYQKSADQENEYGENNLGVLYENGWGVTQDYARALQLYRKAAAQGFAIAEANIGWMYAQGRAVAQDYDQAREWLYKAADQNDATAENRIGVSV